MRRRSSLSLELGLVAALALAGCSGEDGQDGQNGEDGDTGAQGPEGDTGPTGEQGATGPTGAQGPAGDTGAMGAMGDTGAMGAMGDTGAMGAMGDPGVDGLDSITLQTTLLPGDADCFAGGVRFDSGQDDDDDGVLAAGEIDYTSFLCAPTVPNEDKNFNRVSSFAVCTQQQETCDTDTETAAEIVAVSEDGRTLVYSDSPLEVVGFVDITDPAEPVGLGTLAVGGEPTSVAVAGDYALVGVNQSTDFVSVDGELDVIDIATQTSVAQIDLPGQPDSVAVSPDGMYAAVVIENERDEDLGDGEIPQLPAGSLVIVPLSGAPGSWTTMEVDLTGLAGVYEPTDPEPEFVDINTDNIAVVTLQENNAIVLVDVTTATVQTSFSAGTVDLTQVDATEGLIEISQTEQLNDVPREPDGVTWLSTEYFVTADEGDMLGGSRGFTVFDTAGNVVYAAGNQLEHLTARMGHYPDERSGNKGNEPENAEFGVFGDERYLFVNSERSSLVFVYDIADLTQPRFKQALPAAAGPEGALAIGSRNLLVVASEEDARGDKLRSALNIYSYETAPPQYPSLLSMDRVGGVPIPWGAMSGLAADPDDADVLYAVEDSFYGKNRIFVIDTSSYPARIVDEMRLRDDNGAIAGLSVVDIGDEPFPDDDDALRRDDFDEADLAAMLNADGTVNIDPEGIAVADDGGFWVVSEGSGTASDSESRPINSRNMLIKTDADGVIESVVLLPAGLNDDQLRFGFEGVTVYDGDVYVAFQRAWQDAGDPSNEVRIGIWDGGAWSFKYYTLDPVESQNGGWVGLSDITSLGGGYFLVLERDNQGGPDAAIKRLYVVDLDSIAADETIGLGEKALVRDLMPDLASFGGLTVEKVEGCAVTRNGDVWIVNDNDGVDDNSGETQLVNLGDIIELP
jgi:hypothetical protein